MAKLTEYPQATKFDSGDILIKDGTNGTKKITAEDAAKDLVGKVVKVTEVSGGETKVSVVNGNDEIELAKQNDLSTVEGNVNELKTQSNNFENDLEAINLYKYVDIWEESFDVSWTDRTHAMTLRHKVDLKAGQLYYLHITDGGIHYKPSQWVRVWTATKNSTSADSNVFREEFRSASSQADGDIDIKIVPTMDASWMLINFYIEAEESAGSVSLKQFTADQTAVNAADISNLRIQLGSFEDNLEAINIYKNVERISDSFDDTKSGDEDLDIIYKVNFRSGQPYYLYITDNGINYKSNDSQFLRIWSASEPNTAIAKQQEVFGYITEHPDENFVMRIVPTEDAPYLVVKFYLGAGRSQGDITLKWFTTEIWDALKPADPNFNTVNEHIEEIMSSNATYSKAIPVDIQKGIKYRIAIKTNKAQYKTGNAIRIWTVGQNTTDVNYSLDYINGTDKTPICGTIFGADLPIGIVYEEFFTANYDANYLVIKIASAQIEPIVEGLEFDIDFSISANMSLSDLGDMVTNDDVVKLNKDVEPLVLQFGRDLSTNMDISIGKPNRRLTFVHFSDIHAKDKLWKRICEYMNYYKDIIKFAIHTGDYVAKDLKTTSIVDLYGMEKPLNPILNIVGNHDCIPAIGQGVADKETVFQALYPEKSGTPFDFSDWGCTFGEEEHAMYWYKDIAEPEPEPEDENEEPKYIPTKIRIIAVDQYHWTTAQQTFIQGAFTGALSNGYAVITCSHEPFEPNAADVTPIGSGFWTLDPWKAFSRQTELTDPLVMLRGYINSFIAGDGEHYGEYIMHLCGHIHSDQAGTIDNQNIFQWRTMAGTDNTDWQDSNRVPKTKTWDCFNVIQVDRTLGTVSLVRIGCNTDDHMQAKTAFCYDYRNHRLISSQ